MRRLFIISVITFCALNICAQEFVDIYGNLTIDPEKMPTAEELAEMNDEELDIVTRTHVVFDNSAIVEYSTLPISFRNTSPNALSNVRAISGFYDAVRTQKSVNVVMIGDSHVRGNFYPNAVERGLRRHFPNVEIHFTNISKNGVTLSYFLDAERISQIERCNPDLIIVAVGTNEAHGNFTPSSYEERLSQFVDAIDDHMNGVPIIFATPPGSYKTTYSRKTVVVPVRGGGSKRGKGRGRHSAPRTRTTTVTTVSGRNPNPVTTQVAKTIVDFAMSNECAVWDLTTIGGGAHSASNWKNAGMMANDCVHYTATAYNLMGTMLADAIGEGFNKPR